MIPLDPASIGVRNERLARQSPRFLGLYALAMAGGAVSYYPFLTLILPRRVSELSGSNDVTVLGLISFFGALAASAGGILFGALSDRYGGRRPWIAAGMFLSITLLLVMPQANNMGSFIALILLWQLGLNMMLGPLAALGGDKVPDHQKGLLGGLVAFAPAIGALVGFLIMNPSLVPVDWRYAAIAGAVLLMVMPCLLWGRPRAFPVLMQPVAQGVRADRRAYAMWAARLLLQIAEASLFAYLYFWLRTLKPDVAAHQVALLLAVAFWISVPLALLLGRLSDRHARPYAPLILAAVGAAAGLLTMGMAKDLQTASGSFLFFAVCSSLFLALHSGQLLRVLPRPQHRGRDIGYFNLSNTLPSMIMPWLTLALVPYFGFSGLFALLAVLALLSALCIASFSRRNAS